MIVFRFIIVVSLLLMSSTSGLAEERILQFDSRVEVQTNGLFVVTETIKVRAEGKKIRRGIFRDFPTVFENQSGRERKVGFKLLSVKRDGVSENSRIENASRALRIYLGRKEVFLQTGTYTYEIKYQTDRQLRRFDNRVEVYWNATGNFWDFPIDKATATIELPGGATALDEALFTGKFGSTETNGRSQKYQNGNVVKFETTKTLRRYEGMTVAVSFDKNFVTAPSTSDEARWFFRDHASEIFTYGGAALAFLYYWFSWLRVGRDPPEGVIVPRWDLPETVSPALSNYVENRGLSGHGFDALSAAALNLAVKEHIKLEDIGDTVTLISLKDSLPPNLPAGERALMKKLVGKGGRLRIDTDNGSSIQSLARSFQSAMDGEHRSVFYKSNYVYLIPGLLITVLALGLSLYFGQSAETMLLPLLPTVFVAAVIGYQVFKLARGFRSGKLSSKIGAVIGSAVLLIAGTTIGSSLLSQFSGFIEMPGFLGGAATLVIVNVLFFFLMGAPTNLGRQRMDEIAGLRRYLTVAEQDRMNMQGAPEMSPSHYEKLLPFAVALGVEKPWSGAFQTWLAAAVAAGVVTAVSYRGPRWYDGGSRFDADRIGDRMASIGTDIASSMTSSMPAPKSSSSGFSGGGSSGGGGGGGGGGGW